MQNSDKLTKNEKLSQLMDGEWHGIDPAGCAASVCEDEALRAKWARYHMIRDVLKNEPVQADQALVSRICAAIDDEPVYSNITALNSSVRHGDASSEKSGQSHNEAPVEAHNLAQDTSDSLPAGQTRPSWINTGVAGFALAASVALVTVVGFNLIEQQGPQGAPQVAAADNIPFGQNDQAVLPVAEFVANTGSFWVSPASSQRVTDEQRLNMMLSQHIENSPTSVREGLLPYSRLVGYEESSQER